MASKERKNKIKDSLGWRIFNVCNIAFMCFLVVIMFYPIWHVIMASVSNAGLLMKNTGLLLRPAGFSTIAYEYVARNPMIPIGYRNTLVIVIGGTALNIFMTTLAAYFLSRKNQTISKFVMMFIMFTMFFSGGMIPGYLNIRSLGLYDSLWALIVPGAISTFNMIILRTAFQNLPDSLEESATLDGAGELTILFRICIPLSMATIAVLILYYAVGHWNSWFSAMLYIADRKLQPLQLVLRQIVLQNDTTDMVAGAGTSSDQEQLAETVKYAVIVVATLPILCIYPFLQKYFVKGVLVGAVKG